MLHILFRKKCKVVGKLFLLTITYLCLYSWLSNMLYIRPYIFKHWACINCYLLFEIAVDKERTKILDQGILEEVNFSDSIASESSESDEGQFNAGSINESTPLVP